MGPHAVQSDGQTMYFRYEVDGGRWTWSAGLREIHGLSPGQEPTAELMLDRVVEEDRPTVLARFEQRLGEPGPFSCVYRMRDAHGRVRRLIIVGQSDVTAEGVHRLWGFVVDLTEPLRASARAAVAASAEHRAAIEQAKGALMLSFGVEEEPAFELLRAYSSQNNIKLSAVAERIVAGLGDPAYSRAEPVESLLDIVMGLGSGGGRPFEAEALIGASGGGAAPEGRPGHLRG